MVAHVLFKAIDSRFPASISAKTERFIRRRIGFENPLMSDCISMEALEGSLPERAEAVIRANYDWVLYCQGELAEKEAVAKVCREIEPERLQKRPTRFDDASDEKEKSKDYRELFEAVQRNVESCLGNRPENFH